MSRLAWVISKYEGFGVPGAIPTRNLNPGDLRHGPGEEHPADAPDSVGSFPDVQAGWDALEHQLHLYASRFMTVRQAVYTYAPNNENDAAAYLEYVCTELPCAPDIYVSEALEIV